MEAWESVEKMSGECGVGRSVGSGVGKCWRRYEKCGSGVGKCVGLRYGKMWGKV